MADVVGGKHNYFIYINLLYCSIYSQYYIVASYNIIHLGNRIYLLLHYSKLHPIILILLGSDTFMAHSLQYI